MYAFTNKKELNQFLYSFCDIIDVFAGHEDKAFTLVFCQHLRPFIVLRQDDASRDHVGQIGDIDVRSILLVIDRCEVQQVDLIGLFEGFLELFCEVQDPGSTVRFEYGNDLCILQ